MNESPIETRLLNCTAVQSLQTEQRVAHWLTGLRWHVEHSPFYRDADTGKLREIDVTAWRSGSRIIRRQPQSAVIELVIEVKTLRDYHLVFAPRTSWNDGVRTIFGGMDGANSEWIGRHGADVADSLEQARMTPDEIAAIMARFKRANGPRNAQHVNLPPPVPQYRAAAVRETNIGVDRELESSVLWKAILAIRSAIEASRKDIIQGQLSDILSHVAHARNLTGNIVDEIWDELRSSVRHIAVFHPIVILESRLWMSTPGQLTEIDVCRFYQHSGELSEFWCDVVTLRAAPAYLKGVTRHYSRLMRRLRLT
jgi:hypothetical protein